jgi:hypothetical protein
MFGDAFLEAHKVSATQLETKALCERKWGLDKLDGLKREGNKFASRGTELHSSLELWQRDGKIIDYNTDIGKIAAPGLRFLPSPKSHLVEHPFKFKTKTAIYHGFMDLRSLYQVPIVSVWDHKSTTDFKWIKRPEKLRRDPQANLYAVAVLKESEERGMKPHRIEQNWVYYRSDPKKPGSRKVQLHILPDENSSIPICTDDVRKEHFGIMYYDELFENFEAIEKSAAQMLQYHHQGAKGADLPYNVEACSAFGGCPYRDNACKISFGERITSMEAQKTLAEKMRLANAASKEPKTEEPKTAAPKTAASPEVLSLAERMKAAAKGKVATAAAEPASTPATAAAAPAEEAAPAINSPEEARGQDPDAPVGSNTQLEQARERMAAHIASGVVNARLYSHDDKRFAVNVAKLSVDVADAVLATLAKR